MQVAELRHRLEEELEKKIEIETGELLVYGAGNTSALYESCFEQEQMSFSYFVDGNPSKVGTKFLNRKVIGVDELVADHAEATVLIASANIDTYHAIKRNLDEKHIRNFHIDEYVFSKNKDAVLEVFDLLQDEKSKETYANMILARMDREEIDMDLVCANQYFSIKEFQQSDPNEVFVDCGAFVGDSIEQYLFAKEGTFKKIIAFEPEERNYNALLYRADRLKKEWAIAPENLELVNAGVGDKTVTGWIEDSREEKSALGARVNENQNGREIKVYALDDYFIDQKITFLKADIESFEPKMLMGAAGVICRDHPKIAVCIYHNASDMFRIPLMLKEMNLGYHFAVRQHHGSLTQTILYVF